jgi:Fe-S cluster assembly protein SufD
MIAEKSTLTQTLIHHLSSKGHKVPFLQDEVLVDALQFLEQNGIPNNKTEDYKYCNVEAILKKEFQNIEQIFNSEYKKAGLSIKDTITLVLLNGNFSPELSDDFEKENLLVSAFSKLDAHRASFIAKLAVVNKDAFIALNTAFSSDGLFVEIPKDTKLEKTIRVLNVVNVNSEAFLNTRNFIHLNEGAEAVALQETIYKGEHKVFVNSISERKLEKGAHLTATELQNESAKLYSVNTVNAVLDRQAVYDCTSISTGAQLIRNNHNVALNGEYAAAHLYGLFAANGTQLIDNHTLMDHRVPNCESNELYKGIANGKSTGVFNGKIFVQPHAQKTNAYQSSKNILLSDEASIYTKPQLEIYANDVKCSHGTSTGKIDESALFYLKARGIGEDNAKKLLLQAFAGEVIQHLSTEELQDRVANLFENTL